MPSCKIAIIDYGLGNHQSVYHAIKFLGAHCMITNDHDEITKADGYILPGVGAFAEGISNLRRLQLDQMLTRAVLQNHKPILGICLGMQLFAEVSYEYGEHQGLGWIPGKILPIPEAQSIAIPHVGWNNLCFKKKEPLFSKIDVDTNFYFDHSFHFVCTHHDHIAATFFYPNEITAAVQYDHICGVQFHPEKSQCGGLKVLRSFFNLVEKRETASC